LWWFLNELHFWSADLQDMRMRQEKLETSSVFFADKYSRKARECKTLYNATKSRKVAEARKEHKLKGDAIEDFLYTDDAFLMARQQRDLSEVLKDLFDKLYWTVVRKHERISDQQSQNSRQGG